MKMLRTTMVTLLLLLSMNVFAGGVQPAEVTIDFDNMVASGDMWTARTAKNDLDIIGCGIKKFAGGYAFGFCQARDANDDFIVCFTEDLDLLEANHAASTYSYIRFNWDDEGSCTRIDVSNNSFYLPNTTTRGSN